MTRLWRWLHGYIGHRWERADLTSWTGEVYEQWSCRRCEYIRFWGVMYDGEDPQFYLLEKPR